jgi:hypothetical protein
MDDKKRPLARTLNDWQVAAPRHRPRRSRLCLVSERVEQSDPRLDNDDMEIGFGVLDADNYDASPRPCARCGAPMVANRDGNFFTTDGCSEVCDGCVTRERPDLRAVLKAERAQSRHPPDLVATETFVDEPTLFEAGGIYAGELSRTLRFQPSRPLDPGETILACPRCRQRFVATEDATAAENLRLHVEGDEDSPSICADPVDEPYTL